jgi:hypothetical protein
MKIENRNFAKMYWDLLPECNMDFNLLAFLSYIIDVYDMPKQTKVFDGKEYKWFADEFINYRVDYSRSTIQRYLNKLQESGLINIIIDQNAKNHKARYIHLNVIIDSTNDSEYDSTYDSEYDSTYGSKRIIKHTNISSKKHNNNKSDPTISSSNIIPEGNKDIYKGQGRRVRLGAPYGHAKFTDQEWEDLKKDFPTDYLERVRQIDEYCEQTGKTYNNYLITIRKWDQNAKEKNKKPKSVSELKISADEWKKEEI